MAEQSSIPLLPTSAPVSREELAAALVSGTGDEHRQIQDIIMTWTREGRLLAGEDVAALLAFLDQGQPTGMTAGEWEERVNELFNLLRSQPGEVAGLVPTMLRMAAEDTNPVLRMYALQHIALRLADEPNAENRQAMMDHLGTLAESTQNPLAGLRSCS